MSKTLLVILRHENSLSTVKAYIEQRGDSVIAVALDPIEKPEAVDSALKMIESAVPKADVIIMGTKVYDTSKEGPSRLIEFLDMLKKFQVNNKPVCLTHLHAFEASAIAALKDTGLNLSWVENDNLKRDGMSNLGPLIQKAI